ncbi:MAG TPA: alpha/beta hydrolase [Planctomycetales bacterium]|jgi:pimeloyl-ACP methyl ester carboxylesterase|nr:alpha/beta hydrolase [Planctomycetales bacterium]
MAEIENSAGGLTFEDDNRGQTLASGVTFLEAGKGPLVLLLHAFPLSSAMWRQQIEALRNDCRVVAPDLRGFGSSPGFTGAPSVDQMADDAVALLDELKIQAPVVVGGLSMGGYVALAFARRHASRLRALVLADTQAGADDAAAAANRDKMIEFASKNPSPAVIDRMMPVALCANTRTKRPEVVGAVQRIASLQAPAGIVGALKALRDRPDATPMLKEITVPTLVIVGREDALTPPAVAEKLTANIRGARLVVLENAGHYSNLEQPERFNEAVRMFLASL